MFRNYATIMKESLNVCKRLTTLYYVQYSQACIKRSHLGQRKAALLGR